MSQTVPSAKPSIVPPLQNGDRLTRAEFERRFDATPGLKKAELIDGVVYMAPPVSFTQHGRPHTLLLHCLSTYELSTAGVMVGDNSSLRLGMKNMPQPDAFMLIAADRGGRARIDEDGYVVGAPELIGEVAASSVSYDLHDKLDVYRRHEVGEYIVWRTLDQEIDHFVLREGRYDRLPADTQGVYRSEVFPGLWLDSKSLLAGDMFSASKTVQQGLASPEHAAFVQRLGKK